MYIMSACKNGLRNHYGSTRRINMELISNVSLAIKIYILILALKAGWAGWRINPALQFSICLGSFFSSFHLFQYLLLLFIPLWLPNTNWWDSLACHWVFFFLEVFCSCNAEKILGITKQELFISKKNLK